MALVPDEAIDRSHEISGAAFRLYCYYCKRGDRDGLCWPSLKRCAADLRMAYTYTCERRKELIDKGWIELLRDGQIRLLTGFYGVGKNPQYSEKPNESSEKPNSENPNLPSEKPNLPSEKPNSENPNSSENQNFSSGIPNESSEKPNSENPNSSENPNEDSEFPNRKFGFSESHVRNNQPMEPAHGTSPEREPRATAADSGDLIGPNDAFDQTDDTPTVQLTDQETAVCAAMGWFVDMLDHNQWFAVKNAGRTLAAYPDAIPERIIRAPDFYRSQRKFNFAPTWIARDWPQISAWIEAGERGEVRLAPHLAPVNSRSEQRRLAAEQAKAKLFGNGGSSDR